MSENETTAPADEEAMRKAPKKAASPKTYRVERLTRMVRDNRDLPAVILKGDAPAKGKTVTLEMPNGCLYTGKVYDATEADGEALVEFCDGLNPV